MVGDFQEEASVGALVVVAALEAEVLLTLEVAGASPLVWLAVDTVVALVAVALGEVVLVVVVLVAVVLVVVALVVVALAVGVVLVAEDMGAVDLEVALGLSVPLVASRRLLSTKAYCSPSMLRSTLRSKK